MFENFTNVIDSELDESTLECLSILDVKSIEKDKLHRSIFKVPKEDKFVQLKLTPIEIESKDMYMLQIVDISSSIIKQ